jgi:hypothetical protein
VIGDRNSHCGQVLRAYPGKFPAFLIENITELEPGQVMRQIHLELELASRQTNSRAAIEVGERFKLEDLAHRDELGEDRNPHCGQVLRAYPGKFPAVGSEHITELEPGQVMRQIHLELELASRQTNSRAVIESVEPFKLDSRAHLDELGYPLFQREENGTELALMYVKFKSPKTMKFITENGNFKFMAVREEAVRQGMFPEAAFLFKPPNASSARGARAGGNRAVRSSGRAQRHPQAASPRLSRAPSIRTVAMIKKFQVSGGELPR